MKSRKLDIDTLREKYVSQGYPFQKACGLAIGESRQIILDWIIDGGSLLVLFGAPGSGKSWLMNRLTIDSPNILMVEISGINIPQNVFLMKLPRVEYIMVRTPYKVCEARLLHRDKALDNSLGKSSVISLAKKWHDLYNGSWKYALPATRAIVFEEK